MTAEFDGAARVASGSQPTMAVATYDVRVTGGRLRLAGAGMTGAVLDVPLERVDARPLGRAGAAVVEVDGSPVLVDFTRRNEAVGGGAAGTLRRVGPAIRGRWIRRRFLSAAGRAAR